MKNETYTHFGVEVRYAVYSNYTNVLEKHGVEYRRLPIPEMNVICYEPNGQKTYAVIFTDNNGEYSRVYATNSVPEDGWEAMITDVNHQRFDGETPALPHSYFYAVLQKLATAIEKQHESDDPFTAVFGKYEDVNPDDFYRELRNLLTAYGFNATSTAHDVDPAYIARIFAEVD